MKKTPALPPLVGSAYIADALGQGIRSVQLALGSMFAEGDRRVQQVGRSFVVDRATADMLIADWREQRPRGAPTGNQNARKPAVRKRRVGANAA